MFDGEATPTMSTSADVKGNVAEPGATQVNNVNLNTTYTVDDIDRFCLRTLRCPDALAVKNRLKESDKLLYKPFEWIYQDPQYMSWQSNDDVGLLWIKGGAGKGKTMMSIGLIDKLQSGSNVVTYFFCQDADGGLNTLEAILKGLILQLINQQDELKECLRCRWDTVNNRFDEDLTSWSAVWKIFVDMLDRSKCKRLYVVVDALDECRDDGMADFLKLIVRIGLNPLSKVKWLLTSRPLEAAQRELLAGHDQVQVSLERNLEQISEGVNTYIHTKVTELDRRHRYGTSLQQKVAIELLNRAEDTYLWVSLVCKRLENMHRNEALATIQNLPPGLHPLYHRIFNQLNKGEPADVERCMLLLKVMLLAYRPLNMIEVSSVTGLSDEDEAIKALVDRCASFVKISGTDLKFVHQSARDYLAGENGQYILGSYEHYGHGEIALSCLSYLPRKLKANILDLPRPDSTKELMTGVQDREKSDLLASINYAVTFWAQHLEAAKATPVVQDALAEQGPVCSFLATGSLEWLECLSLLDKLPHAITACNAMKSTASNIPHLSILVREVTRFVLRHYQTLANWPLQIYSSAIIFSPQISMIRKNNSNKIPAWFKKVPDVEHMWTPLIQTLEGHSRAVRSVAFSPDGETVVSGSNDGTIKLWDAATGNLKKTLTGHLNPVCSVAFTSDGKKVMSGCSEDTVIKLWDTTTGDFKTLAGHSKPVFEGVVAFTADSRKAVLLFHNHTIELWDVMNGQIQRTLPGHSDSEICAIRDMAFSPNGEHIISGSLDYTIKQWNAITGDLENILHHSDAVNAVEFSPDGKQIISGGWDGTIKLWDAIGNFQREIVGHTNSVQVVAFSPDGKQIASGSSDCTIKLWDATTGDNQKTLAGHSYPVKSVAFSPDGKQLVSGSNDRTIRLWDTTTDTEGAGDLQMETRPERKYTLTEHTISLSPDGKKAVLGSTSGNYLGDIKLWDAIGGDLQTVLDQGSANAVSFSPDGKQLVSSSNTTIKLWDVLTDKLRLRRVSEECPCKACRVIAVAFSPDGKQIVSGSDDHAIRLWDATTGDIQMRLIGHSDAVYAVNFSPDGKQIVSGSRDYSVNLWHISEIQELLRPSTFLGWTFNRPESGPLPGRSFVSLHLYHTLKFSDDGHWLLTDVRPVRISASAHGESSDLEALKSLWVVGQWIHYGVSPILRLPADFKPACHDVQGNHLVIGLYDGRILKFDIDRRDLHSLLQVHSKQWWNKCWVNANIHLSNDQKVLSASGSHNTQF